jgi:hypothetical protein
VREGLRLRRTSTILFNDGTWRWFYEKHYDWEAAVEDDRLVLTWMLSDPTYRFISPVPEGEVTGEPQRPGDEVVHGPYRLECIRTDSFDTVDARTAVSLFEAWAQREDWGIPSPAAAEMSRRAALLHRATGLFWLHALDESCLLPHSYLGPWAELLIVNRNERVAELVVGSSD